MIHRLTNPPLIPEAFEYEILHIEKNAEINSTNVNVRQLVRRKRLYQILAEYNPQTAHAEREMGT